VLLLFIFLLFAVLFERDLGFGLKQLDRVRRYVFSHNRWAGEANAFRRTYKLAYRFATFGDDDGEVSILVHFVEQLKACGFEDTCSNHTELTLNLISRLHDHIL
jgi:hypothetical protein